MKMLLIDWEIFGKGSGSNSAESAIGK